MLIPATIDLEIARPEFPGLLHAYFVNKVCAV
jgi:hypothetical protein